MDLFKKEVEARELNAQVSITEKERAKTSNQFPKRSISTTSTLHAKDDKTRLPICAFCERRHYSAECKTVTSVSARKENMQKSRQCFVCLNTGHMANQCSGDRACRKCKGRHHHSICQKEREGHPETDVTVTASSQTITSENILLQTARTFAFRDNQSKMVPVKILFDSGSQRSYITDELRSKLDLKVKGKETLNLNTFGSNRYHIQSCTHVKVKLGTKDRKFIEISALSLYVVCSSVKTPVKVNAYTHLLGLELADSSNVNASDNINILIGANFYHNFVLGETIRGASGPVALGWLLSGPSGSVIDNNIDTYVVPTSALRNFVTPLIPNRKAVN